MTKKGTEGDFFYLVQEELQVGGCEKYLGEDDKECWQEEDGIDPGDCFCYVFCPYPPDQESEYQKAYEKPRDTGIHIVFKIGG